MVSLLFAMHNFSVIDKPLNRREMKSDIIKVFFVLIFAFLITTLRFLSRFCYFFLLFDFNMYVFIAIIKLCTPSKILK